MTQERDCNTCQMHVQGEPLSLLCGCFCLAFKNLPLWTLRKDIEMEHPYDSNFRDPKAGQLPGPIPASPAESPLETQVGGTHYKGMKIQPIEFCMVNNLDACQSKVIKYVTRKKGGRTKRLEDLDKAIHVIQLYKQLIESGKAE